VNRTVVWWSCSLALACLGPACSSRDRKASVPATAPASRGAVEDTGTAPASSPPLPSPGRLEDLASWADSLPGGVTWVALVPASDLKAMLAALPTRLPRLVRAADETAFHRRIERTWGIDPGRLAGDCVVLGWRDGRVAGLCAGGALVPVSGPRWRDGDVEGALIRRAGRDFRVGLLGAEGPVVLGDPAAVSEVLAARRRQVPSLGPVLQRRGKDLRDLAGSDSFRHAALWFLDPAGIPGADHARLAALFLGPEGFLGVVLAAEGRQEALEGAIREWWQRTVTAVRGVTGQDPDRQEEPGALADLFKDADTPLGSGEVMLRGDRVFLRGQGNPAWTALAARRDLLEQWFGEQAP